MIKVYKKINNNSTIKTIFNKIYKKEPNNVFLSSGVLTNNKVREYTYKEVKELVNINIRFFKKYNLILGDRVAVMMGNNPEFFIIKLSLNLLGLSCVPINNELTEKEITFILKNSKPRYIICIQKHFDIINNILSTQKLNLGIIEFASNSLKLIRKNKKYIKKTSTKLVGKSESSILYTSGTTGIPKGCILCHAYEVNAGYVYAKKKGLISFKDGEERLYNCLPVHHVNAGVLSIMAVMITSNCQIQAERFSLKNFWKDIKYSNATVFHYLGAMAPLLYQLKRSKVEKKNKLRLGVGAGIEPSLHAKFEKKFKIPMVELWGMTEMVCCIFDYDKYREVGTRCFGKASDGLETKVVDKNRNILIGKEGLFLIRFNRQNPKIGFFSGYNKNITSTKKAWENGWFNTGDIVIKNEDGKHFFVDRAKNIIRRSGENISSAEIEEALLCLNNIISCSVLPIMHKIYQEEIFAFIILKKGTKKNIKTAENIIIKLRRNLAYYKLPCYIRFIDNLPLTSSQKPNRFNLKNMILSYSEDDYYNVEKLKRSIRNS